MQCSRPSYLLSFMTASDPPAIGLKFRMNPSVSRSGKYGDSNLCTESSRIFSESEATCCGKSTTGSYELVHSNDFHLAKDGDSLRHDIPR